MKNNTSSLVPEDFNIRFERAFGLVALTANRHLLHHMRRMQTELNLDPDTALVWGTLAQLNTIPSIPLGADPMIVLNELGLKKNSELHPVRLSELVLVTGLPRETVRRKLHLLSKSGKVRQDDQGRWLYLNTAIDSDIRQFTQQTIINLLKTAEVILQTLEQVDIDTKTDKIISHQES